MTSFNKNLQNKAIDSLIHDTNSALAGLNAQIALLTKFNQKYGKERAELGLNVDSYPFVIREYLNSYSKKIQDSIEEYHKEFKTNFNESGGQ